jgi:hypothetical protein
MYPGNVGRLTRLSVLAALAGAIVALSSCSGREENHMGQLDPWHLWGDTKLLVVPHSVTIVDEFSSQLAKVSYGRPETFDFMFGARIVDMSDPLDAGGEISVSFDVTVGVGRSHLTMLSFERYLFYWTAAPPPIRIQKYSAEVFGPPRTDIAISPATTVPENLISEITAQDIQVQARVQYTGGLNDPRTASVEVTAFFAPRSHVRPEWFSKGGKFRGNEDNGT